MATITVWGTFETGTSDSLPEPDAIAAVDENVRQLGGREGQMVGDQISWWVPDENLDKFIHPGSGYRTEIVRDDGAPA